MPYIETPADLADALANELGIYGACPDGEHDGKACRSCWVADIATRIRQAAENEKLLAAPQAQEETRGAPAPAPTSTAGLVWTKEKPTREGWYAWRLVDEVSGDESETHVMHTTELFRQLWMRYPVTGMYAEFAGPLHIPEAGSPAAGAARTGEG